MLPIKLIMIPIEKVIAVDKETSIREASIRMRDAHISALMVNRDTVPIGIITDTDILQRAVANGYNLDQTPVEQVMTAPVPTLEGNKSYLDANRLMAQRHIRHLGVTHEGHLVGLLSISNIVRFLTNDPRQ